MIKRLGFLLFFLVWAIAATIIIIPAIIVFILTGYDWWNSFHNYMFNKLKTK
ncbi:MAG: hypothetical protein ACK50E_06060 [Bacteroidota bacterium]|jgi:uncharacterized membrane protein affecting hemolysin expression